MTPAAIATRLGARAELDHGRPRWWVASETETLDETMRDEVAALGLQATRRMHQLRRPLPLEPDLVTATSPVATRAFDPASDREAWLRVNNAAFAAHPDQGGWTLDDLDARLSEPWVDLDGFRVAERDGRLIGSCWTKVHRGDPDVGEIFVIGADPAEQGRGLGRALVVAGLEWLWSHASTPVAMLYVEADNDAALRLYRRLGFERDHTETCLEEIVR